MQQEAGILPRNFLRIGRIAPVVHVELSARCRHRLRRIHAHRHVDNVHQVYAPIRDTAAAVGGKRAPVAEEAGRIERDLGRRSQPEIVIQTRGRIGIRRRAQALRRTGFVDPCLRVVDLADFAGPHDLRGALEMRSRALLQAHLHDAPMAAGGLHHQAAFAHHVRYRFFTVDVFARLACGHCDEGMPMIRRGDHHRVHGTVFQQFAEIGISARLAIGKLVGFLQVRLVHIADGYDLGFRLLLEIRKIHAAHASAADHADADAVAGGGAGLLRERARSRAGHRRALEEVSSIHGLPSVWELHSIALPLWRQHEALDRDSGALIAARLGPVEHHFDLIEFA